MREGLFQRLHRLVGAVAGRGAAVQLRRAVFVEAHGELRAVSRFEVVRAESGTISPAGVPHVELADVFGTCAVLAFRFHVDLPLASEPVEVVDEQPAHEGLDGAVDVVDRDALLDHLVAVDRHELLRHAGQERGAQAADLRPFARRRHELVQIVGEEPDVAAGAVFENKGESAGCADAGNGRRREAEGHGFRELAQFRD